jgi:hypothetical protein
MGMNFLSLLSSFLWGEKAPLSYKIHPDGTIKELKLGNALLLQNLRLAIVKPNWQGSYADQENSKEIKEEKPGLFRGQSILRGKKHKV